MTSWVSLENVSHSKIRQKGYPCVQLNIAQKLFQWCWFFWPVFLSYPTVCTTNDYLYSTIDFSYCCAVIFISRFLYIWIFVKQVEILYSICIPLCIGSYDENNKRAKKIVLLSRPVCFFCCLFFLSLTPHFETCECAVLTKETGTLHFRYRTSNGSQCFFFPPRTRQLRIFSILYLIRSCWMNIILKSRMCGRSGYPHVSSCTPPWINSETYIPFILAAFLSLGQYWFALTETALMLYSSGVTITLGDGVATGSRFFSLEWIVCSSKSLTLTAPCISIQTLWTFPRFVLLQPRTSVRFNGILCDKVTQYCKIIRCKDSTIWICFSTWIWTY